MSNNQKQFLVKWLGIHVGFGKFENCLSGRRIGIQHFQNNCAEKTNTITIIKNTAGKIFGGFTDVRFKDSDTDQSFLFDMDPGIKVNVVNASKAVCYDASYGPCFGYKDLRVLATSQYNGGYYKQMNRYTSAIGNNYNSTDLKSLGNGSGDVKYIEVYFPV